MTTLKRRTIGLGFEHNNSHEPLHLRHELYMYTTLKPDICSPNRPPLQPLNPWTPVLTYNDQSSKSQPPDQEGYSSWAQDSKC